MTMLPTRRAAARGSTLLEVLMAGAVLIIGLTGVVSMMLRSSSSTRDGAGGFNAAALGASALQDLTAMGYQNLTVSTGLDAGVLFDAAGRRYGRIVTVANSGTAAAPAYTLTVRVDWRDSLGQPRVTTTSTVIGRAPDAG
jgi:Tfp pilus assembly protein PilV